MVAAGGPTRRRQPSPAPPAGSQWRDRGREVEEGDDEDDDSEGFDEEYNPEYDEDSDLVGDSPEELPDDEYGENGEEEEDDLEVDEDEKGDGKVQSFGMLPCPPNLRDISALAAWTASSSKPGFTVAELRAPNTTMFWQSDGAQPHTLNIHFPRVVDIVAIRIYLNFKLDESYTPSKIEWSAGMGYNDLVTWKIQSFDRVAGWVWIDLGEVDDAYARRAMATKASVKFDPHAEYALGHDPNEPEFINLAEEVEGSDNSDESDYSDLDDIARNQRAAGSDTKVPIRRRRQKPLYPVLRCMLLQMRILANHQNGKDTHIRGLQIFARETREQQLARQKVGDWSERAPARTAAMNGAGAANAASNSLVGMDLSEFAFWGIPQLARTPQTTSGSPLPHLPLPPGTDGGAGGAGMATTTASLLAQMMVARAGGVPLPQQQPPAPGTTPASLLSVLFGRDPSRPESRSGPPGSAPDASSGSREGRASNGDWLRIPDLR